MRSLFFSTSMSSPKRWTSEYHILGRALKEHTTPVNEFANSQMPQKNVTPLEGPYIDHRRLNSPAALSRRYIKKLGARRTERIYSPPLIARLRKAPTLLAHVYEHARARVGDIDCTSQGNSFGGLALSQEARRDAYTCIPRAAIILGVRAQTNFSNSRIPSAIPFDCDFVIVERGARQITGTRVTFPRRGCVQLMKRGAFFWRARARPVLVCVGCLGFFEPVSCWLGTGAGVTFFSRNVGH